MKKSRKLKGNTSLYLILILGIFVLVSMGVPRVSVAAEVATWRLATHYLPQSPMVEELLKGLNEVTEKTKGRIKFQVHYGTESGFQVRQYMNALQGGMLDAAIMTTSATAFDFPWLSFFGIHFFCPDTKLREPLLDAAVPMMEDLCNKRGIVPLAYPLSPGQWTVIYSKRNIKSLADFKGMLIRSFDPFTIALAKGLGAKPTVLEKSALYMALQKGTVEGAITGESAAEEMHLDEVCKYMVQVDMTFLPHIVGISKKSWDKVSAEDQKITRDIFRKWHKTYWSFINDPIEQAKAYDYAKSHGMTIIYPPADVKTVFLSIKDDSLKEYINDKKSPQNKEVVDLMNTVLKKYGY